MLAIYFVVLLYLCSFYKTLITYKNPQSVATAVRYYCDYAYTYDSYAWTLRRVFIVLRLYSTGNQSVLSSSTKTLSRSLSCDVFR